MSCGMETMAWELRWLGGAHVGCGLVSLGHCCCKLRVLLQRSLWVDGKTRQLPLSGDRILSGTPWRRLVSILCSLRNFPKASDGSF